ncbi:MAG: arsenate reductase (glutaredoxin) [Gammaproteobacteria bacterium]|jgi:arsenate reductase|nr:arsenate reductase (glutaredoxin) [Gammaproteobacteria bacterium]|tara:strand:- start:824 stop:1174 length:351 start_codon:yes stop_codon:yes gene_type:complete
MSITIFHNPGCSKSQQTLELLNEKGIDPEIVLYLESTLSMQQLNSVVDKLGIEPQKLVRYKESTAKELNLSETDERSAAEWVDIMIENPILIERPIVISGDRAAIGRPPENVLEII